jgi:hypothetical protein
MPASTGKRSLGADSASGAKKRRVEDGIKNDRLTKLSQSVPKSSFEEELDQMSQDIDLKGNSDRDQKWARPDLGDWDPEREDLLFQQIDVEEGNLNGKTAIRLFGVTEVGCACSKLIIDYADADYEIGWTLGAATCYGLFALHLCRCPSWIRSGTHLAIPGLPRYKACQWTRKDG